jgi:hypothetical protein
MSETMKIKLIVMAIAIGMAAVLVGWALNIVQLLHMTAFSGMMVVRAIGVFVMPLGAALGYL